MAEPGEQDDEAGVQQTEVARIPSADANALQIDELSKQRGVETEFIETPEGKREVVVKVNKIVLPKDSQPKG